MFMQKLCSGEKLRSGENYVKHFRCRFSVDLPNAQVVCRMESAVLSPFGLYPIGSVKLVEYKFFRLFRLIDPIPKAQGQSLLKV